MAIDEFPIALIQFYKSGSKFSVFEGKWKKVALDLKKARGGEIILAKVNCDQF